ncbi:GDP/UDP-N,N'-diacetylbacillosamine 2-epimerase (hydrolysing) [Paucimonas lemoignei]|uniref:GDP/UDP-N,N'-diacetylbacillosamine 2-epimerase (Hydrolysing) n=1 Tax=Paucimonas lemoignei TaxID=29443 RepID=A0A4R3HR35_PAULE|nr:UDP-N-acetylglucosamine 2-epimerase [Paucimonas lemoignei]TCS35100.1 GDP/UDP-N,N'-diacetylbacillosamine 2-epimerase (hydrolysing) [Paucimonas lemoignei]
MTRKICYISGTRADFGLMQSTLEAIHRAEGLALSVIVTGMHLAAEYGNTVQDIEAAGLPIKARIPVEIGTPSGAGMARNIAVSLTGFVEALQDIQPDIVLLLGDRGEMLAGALAAVHLNIPVAHIHGGERSGTIDEPIRHAISKLAHFHFTATRDAHDRLIRMGEMSERIWVTGAPGLDGLKDLVCASRTELLQEVGLDPEKSLALLVYHPVVQEAEFAGASMLGILQALQSKNVQIMALLPNSDAGSQSIRAILEQYAKTPGIRVVTHFPRSRFVSWMAAADIMVGNSSAGIIEAATFGTPVINIGSRQNLRERNKNVVDVAALPNAIELAIEQTLARERDGSGNIYGDGKAAQRIVQLLQTISLNSQILAKCNAY